MIEAAVAHSANHPRTTVYVAHLADQHRIGSLIYDLMLDLGDCQIKADARGTWIGSTSRSIRVAVIGDGQLLNIGSPAIFYDHAAIEYRYARVLAIMHKYDR